MITKSPYILTFCLAGCITLLSRNVTAQDDYPVHNFQEPIYQELNLNDDKSLIYEHDENRPSRTIQSIQVDSLVLKSKAVKKPDVNRKEEDALSFNFLYYIIQKYKISDIVDQ